MRRANDYQRSYYSHCSRFVTALSGGSACQRRNSVKKYIMTINLLFLQNYPQHRVALAHGYWLGETESQWLSGAPSCVPICGRIWRK
jgi:hypothetical protein